MEPLPNNSIQSTDLSSCQALPASIQVKEEEKSLIDEKINKLKENINKLNSIKTNLSEIESSIQSNDVLGLLDITKTIAGLSKAQKDTKEKIENLKKSKPKFYQIFKKRKYNKENKTLKEKHTELTSNLQLIQQPVFTALDKKVKYLYSRTEKKIDIKKELKESFDIEPDGIDRKITDLTKELDLTAKKKTAIDKELEELFYTEPDEVDKKNSDLTNELIEEEKTPQSDETTTQPEGGVKGVLEAVRNKAVEAFAYVRGFFFQSSAAENESTPGNETALSASSDNNISGSLEETTTAPLDKGTAEERMATEDVADSRPEEVTTEDRTAVLMENEGDTTAESSSSATVTETLQTSPSQPETNDTIKRRVQDAVTFGITELFSNGVITSEECGTMLMPNNRSIIENYILNKRSAGDDTYTHLHAEPLINELLKYVKKKAELTEGNKSTFEDFISKSDPKIFSNAETLNKANQNQKIKAWMETIMGKSIDEHPNHFHRFLSDPYTAKEFQKFINDPTAFDDKAKKVLEGHLQLAKAISNPYLYQSMLAMLGPSVFSVTSVTEGQKSTVSLTFADKKGYSTVVKKHHIPVMIPSDVTVKFPPIMKFAIKNKRDLKDNLPIGQLTFKEGLPNASVWLFPSVNLKKLTYKWEGQQPWVTAGADLPEWIQRLTNGGAIFNTPENLRIIFGREL